MAYQMVQEGALWPSVMITFGPCWRKVKLSWANIANGSSIIRCWQHQKPALGAFSDSAPLYNLTLSGCDCHW